MKSISFIFAPRLLMPTRSMGEENGDDDWPEVVVALAVVVPPSFRMDAANVVLVWHEAERAEENDGEVNA